MVAIVLGRRWSRPLVGPDPGRRHPPPARASTPALATLAFALMFQAVLVPLDWVSGGSVPLKVPRPLIAGIDFASDRSFLLLACGCLAVMGLVVIAIRDGTTGRFLDAVRGSSTAARSIGINPDRQRLVVFVAGAGGRRLRRRPRRLASPRRPTTTRASRSSTASSGSCWSSPPAPGSVQAAIIGGVTFFVFPALLDKLFGWPGNYLASHPDTTGFVQHVPVVVQPVVGPGRGVHPVRPRRPDLRQAPRGHHRGPGRGRLAPAWPACSAGVGRRPPPSPDDPRTDARPT